MVVAAREWLSNAPRIGRVARPAPQARSDNVVGFTEPEPVIEIAPENRKRIVVDLVGVGWARGTGPVRPIFGLRSWCDPSPSLAVVCVQEFPIFRTRLGPFAPSGASPHGSAGRDPRVQALGAMAVLVGLRQECMPLRRLLSRRASRRWSRPGTYLREKIRTAHSDLYLDSAGDGRPGHR